MNVEEAQEIIKENDDCYDRNMVPEVQCDLLEGMKIIAESLKDKTYIDKASEHDEFYYGSFEESVANLTEEQVRYLARLGWGEDCDSWRCFV